MTKRPHLKTFRDWIRQIFFGMCMGGCDLVPGISGGTMAIILGIYEDFIFSIQSLGSKETLSLFSLKLKKFDANVSWDFLLGLLIGVFFVFALLSQIIHVSLEDPFYRKFLYAFFCGMIAASLTICYRSIKIWKKTYWFIFTTAAIFAYFITSFQAGSFQNEEGFNVPLSTTILKNVEGKEIKNYDAENQLLLNVPKETLAAMLSRGILESQTIIYDNVKKVSAQALSLVSADDREFIMPWLIACGALAISAMMLPGISGCYLLTILGVYPIAIGALADFFRTANFDAFVILSNMGIGIIFGAVLFSQVVGYLLRHFHDITLAALLGFMVGALHTIWPFFHYNYILDPFKLDKGPLLNVLHPYIPTFSDSGIINVILLVCAGFVLVRTLESTSKKIRKN